MQRAMFQWTPMLLLLFSLVLAGLTPPAAEACVGARPLGMGGAFIAVADDANASYWNPAALAFLQTRQATGMYITGEEINYKGFASYNQPVGDSAAVAVSVYTWNDQGIHNNFRKSWASFGVKVPFIPLGKMAVGANLGFARDKELDHDPGVDVSVLYRINRQWSLGLLIQDVNEPDVDRDGDPIAYWQRNIRPGIAYRPTEHLTIAMDIYLLTETHESVMIGAEYRLDEKHILRAGLYGMNAGGYQETVGAGYRFSPRLRIDMALLEFKWGVFSATYSF